MLQVHEECDDTVDMETYYDMGTDYQCPSCRNAPDSAAALMPMAVTGGGGNTLEDSTVQAAVGQLMDLPLHEPMDPLSVEVAESPHVTCDMPEEASAMKGLYFSKKKLNTAACLPCLYLLCLYLVKGQVQVS